MGTYRTWNSVRAEQVANGRVNEDRLGAIGDKMRAEARAHHLAEIRERHNITQTALAERIGVSQSRVSRIERGDLGRAGITTLRNYVEALGGEKLRLSRSSAMSESWSPSHHPELPYCLPRTSAWYSASDPIQVEPSA